LIYCELGTNFLKEGALSRVDLESWRVKSLSTVGELIKGVFHHHIYRSTGFFSGLELRTEEAEIPKGFPVRKCATQPDLEARVQKGKKLILSISACSYWGFWRIASSLILYLGRHIQPSFYILSISFQICRSYVWRSSYYLNKGQI
jgi:hypothetical protein